MNHSVVLVEEANDFSGVAGGSPETQAPVQKARRRLNRYDSAGSIELYIDAGSAFSACLKSIFVKCVHGLKHNKMILRRLKQSKGGSKDIHMSRDGGN